MTRHKCFNCSAPTETQVQHITPPTFRKFICTDARCWRAWWKLTDRDGAVTGDPSSPGSVASVEPSLPRVAREDTEAVTL